MSGPLKLSAYDGRTVRIRQKDGERFDGEALYCSREYLECEFGIDDEALQIDTVLFCPWQIESVEEIETPALWASRRMRSVTVNGRVFSALENGETRLSLPPGETADRISPGEVLRLTADYDESETLHFDVLAVSPAPDGGVWLLLRDFFADAE